MLGWYRDAGLTTLATALNFLQTTDDSVALANKKLYLGDPDATKSYMAASNPGTDDITVSITDPNLSDAVTPSLTKLALVEGDLTTATPGASLGVGTEIDGGAGNGVEVWFTFLDANQPKGHYPLKIHVADVAQF